MLDQAFVALKTLDWGSDPKLLQAIDQAVVDTQGDQAKRAALEMRLAAVLGENVSRDAKDYVCRKLMRIGTAASVPVLAKLLPLEATSHIARFALQQNPTPQAAAVLRDALLALKSSMKVGVIGSLGARRDTESVGVLKVMLGDRDDSVAAAAARALGAIRTADAALALANSRYNAAVRSIVVDASLSCAEGLLADGKNSEALALYSSLASTSQPEHIRLAAIRGTLMCAGSKS